MPTQHLVQILAVLVIILAVLFGVYFYFIPQTTVDDFTLEPTVNSDLREGAARSASGRLLTPAEVQRADEKTEVVLRAGRTGDYAQAAAQVEEILAEGGEDVFSLAQITHARHNSIYTYRDSGSIDAALEHIADLKTIIVDENVSPHRRALATNSLGLAYCGYGRDDRVIAEVFTGPFFEDHWKGAPGPSTMSLLLWAYENLMQTPRAATNIARMYAQPIVMDADLTDEEKDETVAKALEWLAQGKVLEELEISRNYGYENSRRYVDHLYWRAFAIKALEAGGITVSGETADEAYEKFYAVVARQNNHNTYQYLPFASIVLAKFAEINDEGASVIDAHIADSIQLIENDIQPTSNEMTEFIVDIAQHDKGGFVWQAIRDMAEYSDDFSAFIATILANAEAQ